MTRARLIRCMAVVAWLVPWCGVIARLDAQGSTDLLDRGVSAYWELEYDLASALLRRALANEGTARLDANERKQALSFLGAAEVFRGRTDSAAAVFERLVLADARHRIDRMIFPPEVSDIYERVRRGTSAVSIAAPAQTEIRQPGDWFAAWLYASAPHEITVEVREADGSLVRRVFAGVMGDSLEVRWDGKDGTGTALRTGRYFLLAQSTRVAGRAMRVAQVPLDVEAHPPDTLPHPPPPATPIPDRGRSRFGAEALIGGLVGGAAIVLVPAVIGDGAPVSDGRFAIAGGAAILGLIGFLHAGDDRAADRGVEQEWEAWRERLSVVMRENDERRSNIAVTIRVGAPMQIDLEEQE